MTETRSAADEEVRSGSVTDKRWRPNASIKKIASVSYWLGLLPAEETHRPEIDKFESLRIDDLIRKPNIQ